MLPLAVEIVEDIQSESLPNGQNHRTYYAQRKSCRVYTVTT